ncbi:hypothetical protein BJ875DRAFT_366999 [Amylocarpus encephaloides]|uniref:Uncharacterized protein n=1 Tax=Amylocarpus encephaloides TaxID=45428 RepID=A0A9P7YS82_9HELO|nr:hypothetical protein BJ875DRAFT_366999 [Amylocarpus encephaloides]
MGVQPPYLYDAIRTEGSKSPHKPFDPKAVTRASQTPKPPRKKQEGPLVSFNQHPDSFLILPYGNTSAKPMSPSVKVWVKWTRILQLVLRILQVLCAGGLLAFMIILRGADNVTAWIMRIAPGVAIFHTVYGVYHLSRKSAGRPPASSAAYMLFASFFDVSIIPFYTFSALLGYNHQNDAKTWTVILDDQSLTLTFSKVVFLLATIGAGFHIVTLAISLYLAVTFRKISNLPPDMNPLEDNLTSRHKRNKSSVSTMTTTTMNASEKRLSTPLESKRGSGAAYEDLSRPPTIPFFHTRTQSTDSFSTYKSTPPPSRDNRDDLPSRHYQASHRNSNGSNMDLKRASFYGQGPATPPKRQSYTEVPLSDNTSHRSSGPKMGVMANGWYTSDSLSKVRARSESPQKGKYQPVHQPYDSEDLGSFHASPLESNPPTPRRHKYTPSSDSPLSEIGKMRTSGDIADMSGERELSVEPLRENFKAKYYGDLKPATPPVMIGSNSRQVSSGNDFINQKGKFRPRDASGKIAEEGLGGSGDGWGTRYRKPSGL